MGNRVPSKEKPLSKKLGSDFFLKNIAYMHFFSYLCGLNIFSKLLRV